MQAQLKKLVGKEVVVDTDTHLVFLGRLATVGKDYLELDEADAHSIYDTHTSREIYVMEAHKYGIRHNRRNVLIRMDRVVSVSALADIAEY